MKVSLLHRRHQGPLSTLLASFFAALLANATNRCFNVCSTLPALKACRARPQRGREHSLQEEIATSDFA